MGADYFGERRLVEAFGARTLTRIVTRAVVGCVTLRYHDCVVFAQSELVRFSFA